MAKHILSIVFFAIGGITFLLGGIGYFVWPALLGSKLKEELVLTNTSKSYSLWKETPIPMFFEVYMFNWTNPQAALSGKEKPNFVEMGPYTFTEHHSKVNLVWNKNDTVTFNQIRRWKFIPEKSKGTLLDNVTNINVIAMTVGNMIKRSVPKMVFPFIEPLIKKEESTIVVTKTVQELLFDGYSDNFLNIIQKFKSIIKIKIPLDKFGWFYKRNNSASYDGVFNMNTGSSSLDDLGNIVRWNYKKNAMSYEGTCDLVDGSSGELWPWNAASQDRISIFASDICSSLSLARNGSKYVSGVYATVHEGDDMVFDNGQLSPENKCYCTASGCPPLGARDVSKCRFGAPAYISFPHFYLADDIYRSKITGMKPSADLHKTTIALAKVTSIPLEVHARLQINILAETIPGLSFFDGLPNAYLPMVWFDQSAEITSDLADELKGVNELATYVEPSLIGLLSFGLLLLVFGFIIFYFKRKRTHQPSLLSEGSSDS